jgi:hypothetical protein
LRFFHLSISKSKMYGEMQSPQKKIDIKKDYKDRRLNGEKP